MTAGAGVLVDGGIPRAIAALLEAEEIAALLARAVDLLARPEFPWADPERRSHPWPLV